MMKRPCFDCFPDQCATTLINCTKRIYRVAKVRIEKKKAFESI